MSIPFLSNVDLNLNQLLNVIAQQLASDPGSPTEGQLWYNTTTDQLKYRSASATVILYSAATAATASTTVLRDSSGDFAAHDITANKVTGLATPSGTSDAATKAYVDSMVNGLDWKASVRVATTAAATLASDFENGDTVDGVTLATGDRILIKDQAAGAANGIYTVNASGAPTRATDADSSAEVTSGFAVWVSEGTTNGNTGWVLTTDDPITLGTTALVFAQFTGGDAVTAGAGLTKTGSTIDVVGTTNRILVNANDIDISPNYVGQASITTLGTITTGVWTGTTIAVANGGTGATTAAAARTALGTVGRYSATIGDGAETAIVIAQATHGLAANGTNVVAVYNASTGAQVYPDVSVAPGTGNVTLTFAVAPTSNQYRVVIIG